MTATLKCVALSCCCLIGLLPLLLLAATTTTTTPFSSSTSASASTSTKRAATPATSDDLSVAGVRAFAAHLRDQRLPHGLIILHASSIRFGAASRAALFDLMSAHRVSFLSVARRADSFEAHISRATPTRLGVLCTAGSALLFRRLQPLFDGRFAWLIMPSAELSPNATIADVKLWAARTFQNNSINVDADITLALPVPNQSTSVLRLFDVYGIGKTIRGGASRLLVQAKGVWNLTHGWQLTEAFRRSAVRRRADFGGLLLRAATAILEKPPMLDNLTYLTNEADNKQLDGMQRKTYQLLKMLEPMWNVRFEVLFRDAWGSRNRNGKWSGVLGAVVGQEAEFSMCPLRYTKERIRNVQFAPDLHEEIIPFLFRHPRRNAIRNIFFEPLATSVWWCVCALILLAVLLLAVQTRLVGVRGERRRLDFIALIIAEAFFMQGPAPDLYQRTSMRMLILWLCVFSFMLLQFYGGFIVGSLLAQTPRTITTLQALYNSSLLLGMEDISYNYDIFENSTNDFVRQLYAQRICQAPRADHITSIERGAQRIKRGGFAFHVSANRMMYVLKSLLSDDEFCDLQQINLAPPYQSSIVLRKHSPYREHFAAAILQLRTAGLMQRNNDRWQIPQTDCQQQQQNREVDVDLEHFIPALIFLAIAHLFAVVILLFELLIHRYSTRAVRVVRDACATAGSNSNNNHNSKDRN